MISYLRPFLTQPFAPFLVGVLKSSFRPPITHVASCTSLGSNSSSFNSTRSFYSNNAQQLKDWDKELNVNAIEVEPPYDGPKFDDGIITKEFVEEMMECFKNQKKFHKKYAYQIILDIRKMMLKLPSLVDITIPQNSKLNVCGDIHGQFYDFINIFKINGVPSETNMYLFNGDFVDRGPFGLEVVLTLFAYKLLYPKSFYLNRGNHEMAYLNKTYGFKNEVQTKFSKTMFELFSETFDTLPLASLINKKILVVHGGLSRRDNITLDEIKNIYRFTQPIERDLMGDLLWSDPQNEPGRKENSRGIGIEFGPDVTENFLKCNNLDLLIRSHLVKREGYEIEHNGKCITVFSAPNYCGVYKNKGAIISITPDLKLSYKTFEAVPQPHATTYY